jgi:hypothetical protein
MIPIQSATPRYPAKGTYAYGRLRQQQPTVLVEVQILYALSVVRPPEQPSD